MLYEVKVYNHHIIPSHRTTRIKTLLFIELFVHNIYASDIIWNQLLLEDFIQKKTETQTTSLKHNRLYNICAHSYVTHEIIYNKTRNNNTQIFFMCWQSINYTNNTVNTIKLTTTTFDIFTPIDALSNISLQPSDEVHVLHSTVLTYDVSLYAERHWSFGAFFGSIVHPRMYTSW